MENGKTLDNLLSDLISAKLQLKNAENILNELRIEINELKSEHVAAESAVTEGETKFNAAALACEIANQALQIANIPLKIAVKKYKEAVQAWDIMQNLSLSPILLADILSAVEQSAREAEQTSAVSSQASIEADQADLLLKTSLDELIALGQKEELLLKKTEEAELNKQYAESSLEFAEQRLLDTQALVDKAMSDPEYTPARFGYK